MNSIGQLFRLTSFGESHGQAIGGIIDGFPSDFPIDIQSIQTELNRRRPGQSNLTTPRSEPDSVEFLSGIFEGRSTGAPIGFIVRNTNQHSNDYDNLRHTFRPSHADFTYHHKYHHRDHRGGGRTSARETIARVVAGALAKQYLAASGIRIEGYTQQVGSIVLVGHYSDYDLSSIESNAVRCPDTATAERMSQLIQSVKAEGDSIGGIIGCVVRNVPVGLGEPVFNKLHADLGAAMLSINAVKGFDYGTGFDGIELRGSQAADEWYTDTNGDPHTRANHSGGIQGGISNGEEIYFRVAFKPVATLLRPIETIDTHGNATTLKARGRHDPCVLPRAVPIVEAMAAIVLLDHLLIAQTHK